MTTTKERSSHEKLFHIVKRTDLPMWKSWLIRIAAVAASLVVCGVIIILLSCLMTASPLVAGLSVGLLGAAPVAMAQTPVADTLDASETEVITEPLMGIIPMEPQLYYVELSKNPEIKKQFSISMADLGVLGFEVKDFEFDQMKKEAKAFYSPVAKGGQEKLLAFISYNLGEKATKLKGEMELSFNVNTNGKASMVIVKKSVDPEIDFPVVDALNAYTWESAYYVLQSGEMKRVSSDCTLTIQFPLKPATIDDLWIEEALEGEVMAPSPKDQ